MNLREKLLSVSIKKFGNELGIFSVKKSGEKSDLLWHETQEKVLSCKVKVFEKR